MPDPGCLFWRVQTKEEQARAAGPGLLIVDRVVDSVSEEHYYLTPGEGGSGRGLEVTEGAKVAGGPAATCGQVSMRTPSCSSVQQLVMSQPEGWHAACSSSESLPHPVGSQLAGLLGSCCITTVCMSRMCYNVCSCTRVGSKSTQQGNGNAAH